MRAKTSLKQKEEKRRVLANILRPNGKAVLKLLKPAKYRVDMLGNQIYKNGKQHQITFRDEMPIV